MSSVFKWPELAGVGCRYDVLTLNPLDACARLREWTVERRNLITSLSVRILLPMVMSCLLLEAEPLRLLLNTLWDLGVSDCW